MRVRALAIVALGVALSGCGYNRIQQLDERVEEMEGNVQQELMRRNDLIPNLVATVDEAASFERETQTEVARARAGLSQARERMAQALEGGAAPGDVEAPSAALNESMRLFINVAVEAYPQLQANQNFRALQDELTETENRISVARRDYNEVVREYNSYIRQFPQALTAKVIGADRREPFEAPEGAQQAPTVEFGRDRAGSGPAQQAPANP